MRISAPEGRKPNFSRRIWRLIWGSVELDNHAEVVDRLNEAIRRTTECDPSNPNSYLFRPEINTKTMGGDTDPEHSKTADILILFASAREGRW